MLTIKTRKNGVKYYLSLEDVYYVIEILHVLFGHGTETNWEKGETSRKYTYIARDMMFLFVSMYKL